MKEKIDFVILWVDGNDKNWLLQKKKYDKSIDIDDSINRYRDWDNLKYWFRGVEKFAPWVNKIHFVTWGHVPKWLDVNNPKIKIVKHEDFIDAKYLPVFNSNAIEMNINKIPGLNENFVLFNDDMFLIDNVNMDDFFKNDKPCDEYAESPVVVTPNDNVFPHILINNMEIINKHFKKKNILKSNLKQYLNLKYGKNIIRTISQIPYKYYTGFYNPHIPQAFKKSYFDLLWQEEYDQVHNTISNKFRKKTDISQYVVRYYQLLKGDFYPRSSKFGKIFEITDDNNLLLNHIKNQKSKVICLNDTSTKINFVNAKNEVNNAFKEILPDKSEYEL